MFEMDQDYNADNFHDSAPSCNSMKQQYSSKYEDRVWNYAYPSGLPRRAPRCGSNVGTTAVIQT